MQGIRSPSEVGLKLSLETLLPGEHYLKGSGRNTFFDIKYFNLKHKI